MHLPIRLRFTGLSGSRLDFECAIGSRPPARVRVEYPHSLTSPQGLAALGMAVAQPELFLLPFLEEATVYVNDRKVDPTTLFRSAAAAHSAYRVVRLVTKAIGWRKLFTPKGALMLVTRMAKDQALHLALAKLREARDKKRLE